MSQEGVLNTEERKWETKWLESGLISMQNARSREGMGGLRTWLRGALHLPDPGPRQLYYAPRSPTLTVRKSVVPARLTRFFVFRGGQLVQTGRNSIPFFFFHFSLLFSFVSLHIPCTSSRENRETHSRLQHRGTGGGRPRRAGSPSNAKTRKVRAMGHVSRLA